MTCRRWNPDNVASPIGRYSHLAAVPSTQGVRATALGDRVRFGFHYFNDDRDVLTALRTLS